MVSFRTDEHGELFRRELPMLYGEHEAIAALNAAGLSTEVIERTGEMGELTAPRTGEILKPADVVGHLLIIFPQEVMPDFVTVYGKSDTIRVDVCDLNATAADGSYGVVYRDVLWFNRMLVSGLKRQIGDFVLAWMAQGIGKPGQDPPFQLTDAMSSADAVRVAQAWLNSHPEFGGGNGQPDAPAPSTAAQAPLPLPGTSASAPTSGPPAAPVPPAPPGPPAAPTAAPNGNAGPLANLSAEQKAALAALGFPVG